MYGGNPMRRGIPCGTVRCSARRRILGPEHPDTLLSQSSLAHSVFQQGKYENAEKLQRKLLAIQCQVLGSEHPEALTTLGNLAQSLSHQGES